MKPPSNPDDVFKQLERAFLAGVPQNKALVVEPDGNRKADQIFGRTVKRKIKEWDECEALRDHLMGISTKVGERTYETSLPSGKVNARILHNAAWFVLNASLEVDCSTKAWERRTPQNVHEERLAEFFRVTKPEICESFVCDPGDPDVVT
jgi:hypothetical protein